MMQERGRDSILLEVEKKVERVVQADNYAEAAHTLEEINGLLERAFSCLDAESKREVLIAECMIHVLGEERVTLTLPGGMSRANFLERAQAVAKDAHGRDAVYPALLERWAEQQEFAEKPFREVVIAVDGHVAGSTRKTRDEQGVGS